ncbi:MAG: response regulator transcription factor [Acidobacteriota bacterium]
MERPVAQLKIEDALRRVERHRTMLAELMAVQSQTLRELRELVAKTGATLPEDTALPESEAQLRQASLLLARSAAPGRDGPAEARKVLIIDDDPTTRNLIAHFLQKEDFVVIKAADGGDGLARARSGRPDLLVVDAAAPGLTGFELLARLKQDPETRRLPVLILSSLDDEEAIVRSLDAGADYIIKPFSPRILVAKIKMILKEAGDHAVDRRSL